MTSIDARVKVEAGKFRETCQSFINYYKEKLPEISALSKEVIDLKKDYYELYRIFYKPSRWASYDIVDYYRISTPYETFMKITDYIKMFDHSADGLVEMSAHDIKFLQGIDKSEVDDCIRKLDKNKNTLTRDIERLRHGIQERNAQEEKEKQERIDEIIELKKRLKGEEKSSGLKLVSKPEKEDVNINHIYIAALLLTAFFIAMIFA